MICNFSFSLLCFKLLCVQRVRQTKKEKAALIKNDLEKNGRGSKDWHVDTNRNITVVRWFGNGIVQLVSNDIGEEAGSHERCWSGKKKKLIEIPRPLMLEYSIHLGGVDFYDMLLKIYHIRIRSIMNYKSIVFHCFGVFMVNGWLIYRRKNNQKSILSKKQKTLLKFQSEIANALRYQENCLLLQSASVVDNLQIIKSLHLLYGTRQFLQNYSKDVPSV